MALKTFNIDDIIYKNYSRHCKKNGISMSRQVENFLKIELDRLKLGIRSVEKSVKRIEKSIIQATGEHPLSKYC